MSADPLPIEALLPAVEQALRAHANLVLVAPPGAGKTTRVPPLLLRHAGAGQVIMLQPRRVAARASATRIAREQGVRLGDEVGYQVRFERRAGPRTRLLVVTEGILLRWLEDDPLLEGVSALVLDEFHERSLDIDLSLALARRVQQEARPDLRIVVMSATLDPGPVARFLGEAPVLHAEGRTFPIEVRHRPLAQPRDWEPGLVAAVEEALSGQPGGVLCFLPGWAEIRRAAAALAGRARLAGVEVLPLHGDLPPEEQDRALAPGSGGRVVLATNVAETSLTLPGIGAVVDLGLARVQRHDPASGLNRLVLERISRASAEQRAGRAGRTGPGLALRLWSEAEQRSLDPHAAPEVQRVELSPAATSLLAFGETDLAAFPWFEAPPSAPLPPRCSCSSGWGPPRAGACRRRGARWPRCRSTRASRAWWWRAAGWASRAASRWRPPCWPSATRCVRRPRASSAARASRATCCCASRPWSAAAAPSTVAWPPACSRWPASSPPAARTGCGAARPTRPCCARCWPPTPTASRCAARRAPRKPSWSADAGCASPARAPCARRRGSWCWRPTRRAVASAPRRSRGWPAPWTRPGSTRRA
ncbi:MAG: helicase-related protein [Planctomycetia bacterium]